MAVGLPSRPQRPRGRQCLTWPGAMVPAESASSASQFPAGRSPLGRLHGHDARHHLVGVARFSNRFLTRSVQESHRGGLDRPRRIIVSGANGPEAALQPRRDEMKRDDLLSLCDRFASRRRQLLVGRLSVEVIAPVEDPVPEIIRSFRDAEISESEKNARPSRSSATTRRIRAIATKRSASPTPTRTSWPRPATTTRWARAGQLFPPPVRRRAWHGCLDSGTRP